MTALNYDLLFDACKELFGPDIETCPDFLSYLQASGIKSAFRRMAKETHPDHFANKPHHLQDKQAAHFCRVKSAYETLSVFVSQREKAPQKASRRFSAAPARQQPPPAKNPFVDEYPHGVPKRTLQLGRFLYYRQVISFQELLQAVSWQRSSRGSLGLIAREWGWMTAAEVFTVITAKVPGRFGEKAIRLGLLDPARLQMILMEQKIRHQRIGQYFVQSKLLTPQELNVLLKELRLHNSRFGSF